MPIRVTAPASVSYASTLLVIYVFSPHIVSEAIIYSLFYVFEFLHDPGKLR